MKTLFVQYYQVKSLACEHGKKDARCWRGKKRPPTSSLLNRFADFLGVLRALAVSTPVFGDSRLLDFLAGGAIFTGRTVFTVTIKADRRNGLMGPVDQFVVCG